MCVGKGRVLWKKLFISLLNAMHKQVFFYFIAECNSEVEKAIVSKKSMFTEELSNAGVDLFEIAKCCLHIRQHGTKS